MDRLQRRERKEEAKNKEYFFERFGFLLLVANLAISR